MDCASWLSCLDGDIPLPALTVAKGDSTTCIDTYYILVKLADDDAGLSPLVGMWTCLILNMYVVADWKRW